MLMHTCWMLLLRRDRSRQLPLSGWAIGTHRLLGISCALGAATRARWHSTLSCRVPARRCVIYWGHQMLHQGNLGCQNHSSNRTLEH